MLEWLGVVCSHDALFGLILAMDMQTIAHRPHVKPAPHRPVRPDDTPNPLHFFLFLRVLSAGDGFRMTEYG